MTGGELAFALAPSGAHPPAELDRLRAAGVERAAGRRVGRVRRLASELRRAARRGRGRHGRDQGLGVGVRGRAKTCSLVPYSTRRPTYMIAMRSAMNRSVDRSWEMNT